MKKNNCVLQEPKLVVNIEIDNNKYSNKLSKYNDILKDYFNGFDIYSVIRTKKMNFIERIIDFFSDLSPVELVDALSDTSVYYVVVKNNVKQLVNIDKNNLKIYDLDSNTKKVIEYEGNIFKVGSKLKIK